MKGIRFYIFNTIKTLVYNRLGFYALFCWCVSLPSMAQPEFTDQSINSEIGNTGSNHGISFGDINNDGLEDIYVAVRELGIPNKLYLNRGNLSFEEIGPAAGVNDVGVSTAATWGDINNDGWLDLYVGNTDSENKLYLNKGDLTFEDITFSAGVGAVLDPRSVQFVDVDNDGFLDIYVHNYNTQNILFKNNQDNTFQDITIQSGALNIDPAMGTIFFDMDGDGDQDLYALNDGGVNVLFENTGGGNFVDISEGSGLGFNCFCMGVDYADFDLDGDYDIYISNYGKNFLMVNNGDGTFTDQASLFEVDDNGMGWGTFWFDYDNDGDQDLYLANHQFISSRPNILYRNDEGRSFQVVSTALNIESPYASFGTASADVNNDGNLDIFVANWGTTAINRLFVNETEGYNSILVKAIGTVSNQSAIGTTVTISTGVKRQRDQITGATGYASQNSLVLHFGLGLVETVDKITIDWPSGLTETYKDLPVNQYYTVTEGTGIVQSDFSSFKELSTEEEKMEVPQSFPNPFSSETFFLIPSGINEVDHIEIYSIKGALVKKLYEAIVRSNQAGFIWNGTNAMGLPVTNGIYLYKIIGAGAETIGTGRVLFDR